MTVPEGLLAGLPEAKQEAGGIDRKQGSPTLLEYHALIMDRCHDICTRRAWTGHEERSLSSANPLDKPAATAGVVQVLRDRRAKGHSEGLSERLAPRKNQKRECRGCPSIFLPHVRHTGRRCRPYSPGGEQT